MDETTEKLKTICIICPVGCEMETKVLIEKNKPLEIKGFRCPKGRNYAEREIVDPRRTLMTIIKVRNGHLPVVSVKTSKPIPKNKLFDAVKAVSKIEVEAPVKIGDIIIDDLLGTGVSVIATNYVKKNHN
jgi:CxxC motif-containing protein